MDTDLDRLDAVWDSSPEAGVRRLLEWIGEDPDREGLVDTPSRVVRALREMTAGYKVDPAALLQRTFVEPCDEMVVVRGISFTSLCEHHLLAFSGTATVAYMPCEVDAGPDGASMYRVVGLSKIPRLVDAFARRLQVQERLTAQIAHQLERSLQPRGVGVLIEARHSCMGHRGVRQPDASMLTSSLLGHLRDSGAARAEFMALAGVR